MARSSASESVVARGARVLEAFAHDRRTLTVAQIARRAGLPVPTAHRLVGQLLEVGFLEREGDRTVRIGVHLWEIGVLARTMDLREAAMPYLVDVHAATGQHTQINVLDGHDVLVVERLKDRDAFGNILLTPGRRIRACAVAGGIVLLAHSHAALQDAVLAAPLHRYTDRTPVDPERMRELWAMVRRNGHIVCDRFVDPEAMSIAVPIIGADDTVVAAVCVVVPSQGAQPMTHIPVLIAAARGIARDLRAPAVAGRTRMITYRPQ